jgi:hypothetical protein
MLNHRDSLRLHSRGPACAPPMAVSAHEMSLLDCQSVVEPRQ